MTVYNCGTPVSTNLGKFEGTITAVAIRFTSILYEVTYIQESEFKTIWLHEEEFNTTIQDKRKIGFK